MLAPRYNSDFFLHIFLCFETNFAVRILNAFFFLSCRGQSLMSLWGQHCDLRSFLAALSRWWPHFLLSAKLSGKDDRASFLKYLN